MSAFRSIYNTWLSNSNTDYTFKKWIVPIVLIKLGLFVYYNICFHLYPELSVERGVLYIKGGDTFTYYPPLIDWLRGGGYGNACRMPGLALPFVPLYWFTNNEELTYNLVVVFQFVLSTISVYILGLLSNKVFNNNHNIFLVTVLMYSFWYHIGDHYLMADSLSISTLLFSVYYFVLAIEENFINKWQIFYSGFFFTWSIFTRLIAIVPFVALWFVILYWLIFKHKQIKRFFTTFLLFVSCFTVCESLWMIRNKVSLNRIIAFTVPECYTSFGYNWLELAKIPTAWGLETTPWAGEINWWLDKNSTAKQLKFNKSIYTKSFNADSLTKLKNEYWKLRDKDPIVLDQNFAQNIALYLQEYKNENTLNYYFLHPIKLFFKFHYKKRIEGMPFPAVNNMNLFQKVFKAINWMFILTVSVLFLSAPFLLFTNRGKLLIVFLLVPYSISIFLVILGVIEQRYFWPIIPFCIVFFAYVVDRLFGVKNKMLARSKENNSDILK